MTEIIDLEYQNGKIYMVKSDTSDKQYIGSTKNTLNNRWGKHKADYNSDKVLGGYKDIILDIEEWYIELYENYPCNNKTELERRETEVQRNIPCINKRLARRTPAEWYQDNRDIILEKKKVANKTPEKAEQFRERERSIGRNRIANMTLEQIEIKNKKQRILRVPSANMTPEKLEKERKRNRERKKDVYQNMTPEKRKEVIERNSERYANMTREQKKKKNERERELYLLKKQAKSVENNGLDEDKIL